jgi:hypothetical protein
VERHIAIGIGSQTKAEILDLGPLEMSDDQVFQLMDNMFMWGVGQRQFIRGPAGDVPFYSGLAGLLDRYLRNHILVPFVARVRVHEMMCDLACELYATDHNVTAREEGKSPAIEHLVYRAKQDERVTHLKSCFEAAGGRLVDGDPQLVATTAAHAIMFDPDTGIQKMEEDLVHKGDFAPIQPYHKFAEHKDWPENKWLDAHVRRYPILPCFALI